MRIIMIIIMIIVQKKKNFNSRNHSSSSNKDNDNDNNNNEIEKQKKNIDWNETLFWRFLVANESHVDNFRLQNIFLDDLENMLFSLTRPHT